MSLRGLSPVISDTYTIRESGRPALRGRMTKTKLRMVAMLVPALLLAAGASAAASQSRSGSELTTAPSGWMPVAYGNAELFVPASWYVTYEAPPCPQGSVAGEMFVNPKPGTFHCPMIPASGPKTTVSLGPPRHLSTPAGQPSNINGILVYPLSSGSKSTYLVPSLHVQISVSGPLGQRVLHTLGLSPRAAALAPGLAPVVPPSWQVVSFGGLSFSVPAGWPIVHTQVENVPGNPCRMRGVAFSQTEVSLSSDARPFIQNYMCVVFRPTPFVTADTVQVDSEMQGDPFVTLSFPTRCLEVHGLTVCPSATPEYSILFLRVTVPGREKPFFVSIGLAGDGTVARTTLYSLRPGQGA